MNRFKIKQQFQISQENNFEIHTWDNFLSKYRTFYKPRQPFDMIHCFDRLRYDRFDRSVSFLSSENWPVLRTRMQNYFKRFEESNTRRLCREVFNYVTKYLS